MNVITNNGLKYYLGEQIYTERRVFTIPVDNISNTDEINRIVRSFQQPTPVILPHLEVEDYFIPIRNYNAFLNKNYSNIFSNYGLNVMRGYQPYPVEEELEFSHFILPNVEICTFDFSDMMSESLFTRIKNKIRHFFNKLLHRKKIW